MNKLFTILLLIIASPIFSQVKEQVDYYQKLQNIAIIDQKVMMPMRDGIRLSTDIYRPKTDKPVPIIFSKTPYNFNMYRDGKINQRALKRAYEVVSRGYAYVVQNERGRFFSEGEWEILGMPTTDAYDAFDWLEKQKWSNGKIGTFGCSSTAEWQMAFAAMDHPAHAAMVPMGYGAGVGKVGEYVEQGNWFRGGAVQMLFIAWLYNTQHDIIRPQLPKDVSQEDLQRIQRFYDMSNRMPKVDWSEGLKHLPIKDIIKNVHGSKGYYDELIIRKPNDTAWYKGGLYHDNMPFGVPSFWFTSWYDVSIGQNLALFNHVRNNIKDKTVSDNQYLVIAPTLHCGYYRASENTIVGERSVGDARLDYDKLIYDWFDLWLKGEKNKFKKETPRVQYFTMGTNKWQTSETWPPENITMTNYYLNSDGNANTLNGDGKLLLTPSTNEKIDTFTYNPQRPVSSYGGNVCCTGNAVKGGSFDQQEMELRNDILVYTSDVLKEGIEVTGFINCTIYISSDVKDTDFTLKLIDVDDSGKAYNLDETIQRVRYREGYDKEVFMKAGEVYELKFSALATSNYFKKGHKIRIEISSSNFPRFARNLNTGGDNFNESKSIVAHNKVIHSKEFPSHITLPIIKNE